MEGFGEQKLIECSRRKIRRVSRRCLMYVCMAPWVCDVVGLRQDGLGIDRENCADRYRLRGRHRRLFRNVSLNNTMMLSWPLVLTVEKPENVSISWIQSHRWMTVKIGIDINRPHEESQGSKRRGKEGGRRIPERER